MPAGAPAADRAVGSSVLLRRLQPDFDDIELYWVSCLFIRGELYLDNETKQHVLSLGFSSKHSWGIVLPKSDIFSECWSMRIDRHTVEEHITEMLAFGFAKPAEMALSSDTPERYTAVPTSPCASLSSAGNHHSTSML